MINSNIFGKRVQSLRCQKNLTRAELGDLMGIDDYMVTKIELAKISDVSDIFNFLNNFCDAISIDIADFFQLNFSFLEIKSQKSPKKISLLKKINLLDQKNLDFIKNFVNFVTKLNQNNLKFLTPNKLKLLQYSIKILNSEKILDKKIGTTHFKMLEIFFKFLLELNPSPPTTLNYEPEDLNILCNFLQVLTNK